MCGYVLICLSMHIKIKVGWDKEKEKQEAGCHIVYVDVQGPEVIPGRLN